MDPDGQDTIKQGTLIAFPLKEFLSTGKLPRLSVLYTPGPRASVDHVRAGRDAVYATIFENVTGSVHAFRVNPATGVWDDTRLDLPAGGSPGIASANDFGSDAYFTYQGFLTPTTLFAADGAAPAAPIKSLPARFDAAPYATAQYEATSKDGTKIPLFRGAGQGRQGPEPHAALRLWRLRDFANAVLLVERWRPLAAQRRRLCGGEHSRRRRVRSGLARSGAEDQPAKGVRRFYRGRRGHDQAQADHPQAARHHGRIERRVAGGHGGGGTPDLFGAVVCQVPLLDMLRFTKLGAGASWVGEYGDPENPVERAAILAYSPYQNVKRGVKYPPIFFVTATSDDRVTPVHARKMAAKMEAQGHDVLFYENTEGGHAAAANHAQAAEMNALGFVYLARAGPRTGRPTRRRKIRRWPLPRAVAKTGASWCPSGYSS